MIVWNESWLRTVAKNSGCSATSIILKLDLESLFTSESQFPPLCDGENEGPAEQEIWAESRTQHEQSAEPGSQDSLTQLMWGTVPAIIIRPLVCGLFLWKRVIMLTRNLEGQKTCGVTYLKCWRKNICQLKILHPAKRYFKNKGESSIFAY